LNTLSLSLHLGSSFADLLIFEGSKLLQNQLLYLHGQSLSSALKNILSEHKGQVANIYVSCRHLDKILGTKLGGSVAQIVTRGFENWALLRQPTFPHHFELKPSRLEPLASQENIFGINERISARGEVVQALQISELEIIASKLKLMNIKKVCINLLFSHKNSKHLKTAVQFFKEQGFGVFAAERLSSTSDEIPVWRKNILNACLAGTFEELKSEILKPFDGLTAPKLLFLLDGKSIGDAGLNDISSTLHGWAQAILERTPKNHECLYVGLENWWFLNPTKRYSTWESPWGLIEADLPAMTRLRTQPTSELKPDIFECLQISPDELGFEPGPMSFGRALRPCAFDMLYLDGRVEMSWAQESGRKRYREALMSFIKTSKEYEGVSAEKLNQKLVDRFFEGLGLEVLLNTHCKKIWLTGFFAELVHECLRKRIPNLEFVVDPEFKNAEALGTLMRGQAHLQGGKANG
jgi:hypothetical protein